MSRRDVLAVAFIVLGFYLLASLVRSAITPTLRFIKAVRYAEPGDLVKMTLEPMVWLVPLGVGAGLLILCADGLARRLGGTENAVATPNFEREWQSAALGVAFACIGLYLVVDSGTFLAETVVLSLLPPVDGRIMGRGTSLERLLGSGIRVLFGIYLLSGAPALRRFALRRLESSARNPGSGSGSDRQPAPPDAPD